MLLLKFLRKQEVQHLFHEKKQVIHNLLYTKMLYVYLMSVQTGDGMFFRTENTDRLFITNTGDIKVYNYLNITNDTQINPTGLATDTNSIKMVGNRFRMLYQGNLGAYLMAGLGKSLSLGTDEKGMV